MGKPNAQPSDQTPTTHFSHPHPLHLSNNPQSPAQILHCSACQLDASAGPAYACQPCNFILHPKCYQLPQQIKHPFDQKHALVLNPKPVYPEGLFRCDACGNQGAGFSYHCGTCGVDLHATCASLPMEYSHQCHPHPLSLTFSPPYDGNKFSCDVCKRVGAQTWIYRCNKCEFDVHVTCVATVIPAPPPMIRQAPAVNVTTTMRSVVVPSQQSIGGGVYGGHRPPPQPVVMAQPQGQFVATAYPAGMMPQMNNMQYNSQPYYGAPQPRVNSLTDQLAMAAVNGVAGGIAQSTTQVVLQEFLGLGGGGGGSQLDVMGIGGGGTFVMDGGSYDGGYGGVDGGYSGGDGSY